MRPTMLRLLYVDDEPDLLHLVRTALRDDAEIKVLTAGSAQEALDLLEREPIHVVLSDYSMPRTNGLALLSEVRRRFGDIPFILFTGRGSEEVVIEALNGRADLFIRKQADIGALLGDLVPRLHAMVARHQADRARTRIEAQYHAVFEHADRGLILYNQSGQAVEANTLSRALLGTDVEKHTLDDLTARLALEEKKQFLDLVDAVRTDATTASGRFSLANEVGPPMEITLKNTGSGQLLLVIEDVKEREALEARTREMEKRLDLVSSTLRQQVERSTLVIRGLANQLSRNVTARRDLALIERIMIANEEIRSDVAYALRHRPRADDPARYLPLLPIVRRAARAAGVASDGYVAECPEVLVSSDAWLERVIHQLFTEAVRTGAEDIRLSASVDGNSRLVIRFGERRGTGLRGDFGEGKDRLSVLQGILDDCPLTVEERKTPAGFEFDICVPAGSYHLESAE